MCHIFLGWFYENTNKQKGARVKNEIFGLGRWHGSRPTIHVRCGEC